MEKAYEFSCPICGSLCQTTTDMQNQEFQCLICMSQILVPDETAGSEGLEIDYFVRAGVLTQRLKGDYQGAESQTEVSDADDDVGFTLAEPETQPAETTPRDRQLFEETVTFGGKSVPLSISLLRIDLPGVEPVSVREVTAIRFEVNDPGTEVSTDLSFQKGTKEAGHYAFQVSGEDSKLVEVIAGLLAVLKQIRRSDTTIELVGESDIAKSFWDRVNAAG